MQFDVLTVFMLLGINYVFTRSSIFAPVRTLLARAGALMVGLVYCCACTGFWVGFFYALAHRQPWLGCVELGFASCGLGAIATYFFHDVDHEIRETVKLWQDGENGGNE